MIKCCVCVNTILSSHGDNSNIDHFSLNQCRSEDITLKEDIGSGFLNLIDFGKNDLPWLCRAEKLNTDYILLFIVNKSF